jgi:hypothetical protein
MCYACVCVSFVVVVDVTNDVKILAYLWSFFKDIYGPFFFFY